MLFEVLRKGEAAHLVKWFGLGREVLRLGRWLYLEVYLFQGIYDPFICSFGAATRTGIHALVVQCCAGTL